MLHQRDTVDTQSNNRQRMLKFKKCLVAVCHSFCLFYIFYNIHTVQSSNHIHTIHSPRPLSISSSLVAQWERPPCGAEPGIELGPAFQQADALPTEPRRTIQVRDANRIWKWTNTTHAVQGGLLWGHKSTPVKYKNMLFPSACSSPLVTEDLSGIWPGRYMRMDSPKQHSRYGTTVQSVRYHTINFRLQACYSTACYQPGQVTWLLGVLGSEVHVCVSAQRHSALLKVHMYLITYNPFHS